VPDLMMIADVTIPLKNWRLIHLLGVSNLRSRYARSSLGQAWLTISLLIQLLSTGLVWSVLWHMPVREFLPYMAVSQIIYQFLAMVIQDATSLFISDKRLYINQRLSFFTSIFSNVYKSAIVFAHNLTIIGLFVFFYPGHTNTWMLFLMLGFLPILLVFLVASSYVIASICTRYRDLIQVVMSLMNISFLLTPIMWKLTYVPEHLRGYLFINPFTAFLEVFRNPLLGIDINVWAYYSIGFWTTLALLMMVYLHRRFENRIIYWV
jgi:lipopolysaccharide transport system permease protein